VDVSPAQVRELLKEGITELRQACGQLHDAEILSLIRQIAVEEPSRGLFPRLMALWPDST